MFPHAFSSGISATVLDMTADFTPVFVGIVLLMGFCVLAFAFAIGVHDTREAARTFSPTEAKSETLPKAA